MPSYVRKLTRVGKRSLCVVIPAQFIRKLSWREKQKVVLSLFGRSNRISVRDWKKGERTRRQ